MAGRNQGKYGRPVERPRRGSGGWLVGRQAAPVGWREHTAIAACLIGKLELGVNLVCAPGVRWIVGGQAQRVRDEEIRRNEARKHVGGRIEKWCAAAIGAVEQHGTG